MRLQTRLTLAFVALAAIPVAASGALMTARMEATFDAGFSGRTVAALDAVRARFAALGAEVDEALGLMARDPLLESELLIPLARGRFHGVQERERAIVREAQRLITSPAVDTLRILDRDGGGRVLAVGHRRGLEPPDPEAVALADAGDRTPVFRHERVENPATGTADAVWTLQVVHPVDERVALVGGRRLDRTVLDSLALGVGADIALALEADGERVAATFPGEAPPAEGAPWEVTRLDVGGQRPAAGAGLTLRFWASRAGQTAALRDLWVAAGTIGGLAILLAVLAGAWISRRISKPLERLAAAASEVAAGARDAVVPEPRGRDEVARLTRAFNAMTSELGAGEERLRQSERVAAWREIARRIAHEIKNPLFPIQMSIQNLQKARARQHPDFEEIFDEATGTILEEVARMKRIVTEFSDFARMPSPRPVQVDLAELVRQLVTLHSEVAPSVRVRYRGPEVLEAVVDPDQLRQLVTNLLKNAVEAVAAAGAKREGGEVEAVLTPAQGPGHSLSLVITDTGPGMDAETLGRLFTPYFTTKPDGTGLGLAIVRRICEEHGGEVRASATPGVGTRFEVRLPA